MASQPYSTDGTQQAKNNPTSPWTETFRSCSAESRQSHMAQEASNRSHASEEQLPTHEALSVIYNRE
jgi:hypothetical protein